MDCNLESAGPPKLRKISEFAVLNNEAPWKTLHLANTDVRFSNCVFQREVPDEDLSGGERVRTLGFGYWRCGDF